MSFFGIAGGGVDHGAQVSGSDRLKNVPLDREEQRGSNGGRFIPWPCHWQSRRQSQHNSKKKKHLLILLIFPNHPTTTTKPPPNHPKPPPQHPKIGSKPRKSAQNPKNRLQNPSKPPPNPPQPPPEAPRPALQHHWPRRRCHTGAGPGSRAAAGRGQDRPPPKQNRCGGKEKTGGNRYGTRVRSFALIKGWGWQKK
jgi:hypothetical protein